MWWVYFPRICNITHFLLVIRIDVMRLPFIKCAMSLTNYWPLERMWWDYFSQSVQCHSLPVSHSQKRYDETAIHKICKVTCFLLVIGKCDETAFHKMCNVIYSLLVIGKNVMRLPLTNVQCHSLAVGHGKYVMRLPFTACAMSLTPC